MKPLLKYLPLLLAFLLAFSACAGEELDSSADDGAATTPASAQGAGGEKDPFADATLKEIYDEFMTQVKAELPSLVETPVNRENFQYYFGLSDLSVAESTFVSEPMMGAIPFGISLLRVKDGKDASAIAAQMKKDVDPRRWVCVTASYVETAVKGNLVLLVLDNDRARGAEIIEAFSKL